MSDTVIIDTVISAGSDSDSVRKVVDATCKMAGLRIVEIQGEVGTTYGVSVNSMDLDNLRLFYLENTGSVVVSATVLAGAPGQFRAEVPAGDFILLTFADGCGWASVLLRSVSGIGEVNIVCGSGAS